MFCICHLCSACLWLLNRPFHCSLLAPSESKAAAGGRRGEKPLSPSAHSRAPGRWPPCSRGLSLLALALPSFSSLSSSSSPHRLPPNFLLPLSLPSTRPNLCLSDPSVSLALYLSDQLGAGLLVNFLWRRRGSPEVISHCLVEPCTIMGKSSSKNSPGQRAHSFRLHRKKPQRLGE